MRVLPDNMLGIDIQLRKLEKQCLQFSSNLMFFREFIRDWLFLNKPEENFAAAKRYLHSGHFIWAESMEHIDNWFYLSNVNERSRAIQPQVNYLMAMIYDARKHIR